MNTPKPITVNGIQYASLNEASIATGIGRKTLRIQKESQGNLIEYFSDRKPPNYWTLERVKEIAKTCETRAEFWKKNKGAALRAQRQGWLDQIYDHMELIKEEKGYWQNFENVQNAALDCKTRSEFIKKYSAAWNSAKKNGWLEELCKHMVIRKSSGEYIVRKFLMSHDIKSISQKKFLDCRDKKPLPFDEYLPDFKILIEIQGIQHKHGWSQRADSFAYISKHDQIKKEYAIKNGYRFLEIWEINEKSIVKQLKNQINNAAKELGLDFELSERNLNEQEEFELETLGMWTFEKVKRAALKCKSPRDFQIKNPSAYSKAHKMGWADELFDHMERDLLPHGYWTRERIAEVAKKCKTKVEFQKKYVRAYTIALRDGFLEDISQHMHSLRVPTWTLESIKEIVKDCEKYSEFKSKFPSAYNVARKNRWLDEVRAHMSPSQLPHGYWNDLERVMEAAKKCRTRTEFQNRFGSARNSAKKHGWMDLVCAHMEKFNDKIY